MSAIIPLEEGKEWIIIITTSYYSFKKFLHFWLAKIPPIIYHNWLLSNNLKEFCNMWKMAQRNCQKAEQLTKKTWWRGWVVLVVSTKWWNISLVSRFVISKSNAKSVPYDSVFVVIFIMYNKAMVRFGFCDILNNQGLSSCYQLQPLARLITLTSTLMILDTTKTSSNNNYCLLFMHFQENITYEWRSWRMIQIYISVETVQIRIVGDENVEVVQGRPFGFEVECVTADGELTQGVSFLK